MQRTLTRVPQQLAAGALLLLAAGMPVDDAAADGQWQCQTGPDGDWQCEATELDTGPYPRDQVAPVMRRPSTRPAGDRETPEPRRVAGQSVEQAELNWVPRHALPAETRETVPEWCAGAYQEPLLVDAELGAVIDSDRVDLSAQEAEYLLGQSGTLDGAVSARQGERRAHAQQASFDESEQRFVLDGDVRLEEPGMLLRGERAEVNLATGDASVDDATFVFYEGSYRGSADKLEREAGVIRVENASFTRCAPGSDGWKVMASKVEVPEGGKVARARNATLRVGGWPVLWTPWLQFPLTNERQSGFLTPSLGYSSESGVDLAVPYYFNLAPNYDATLTPRWLSERGTLVEGEVRQLGLGGRMRNVVGGAYMPEDDNYNGQYSFDEFEERIEAGLMTPGVFEAEERWLAQFRHQGQWAQGLTTEVDFAEVSDDDYFRDLGTDLSLNVRSEIDRTARMRFRRGGLQAQLWAQDLQILEPGEPDTYQRLPQFDLSWFERPSQLPLVVGMDAQYARFDRDDSSLQGFATVTGDRAHVAPRVRLPFERSWGWLTAEGAWHYTRYDLEDPLSGWDDSPTRSLPSASVDAGLRFERDALFGSTPLLQTLEPRVHYLYVEQEDQSELPLFDTTEMTFGRSQLFRENRFAGVDRINDADQLTLALTSRLISRTDGTELMQATLGRILYFEDREVSLSGLAQDRETASRSGWVSELAMRLAAGMDARALWVWNAPNEEQRQRSLQIRYQPDARRILNLGYRKRGDDLTQVDAGIVWPLSPQVSMIGRYFYDLEEERVMETFGGLQYDDCCWRLRLVGRQFRRHSRGVDPTDSELGIFVEVVMKGLAGFDSGLNSVLERGIRGYREHPLNDF